MNTSSPGHTKKRRDVETSKAGEEMDGRPWIALFPVRLHGTSHSPVARIDGRYSIYTIQHMALGH